jgi:hypothetical protein
MSIDDRLRTSLQWEPSSAPPVDAGPLDSILGRVTRRRRIRVAAVATAAATTAIIVAVAAPWAMSRSDTDPQPVKPPTTGSSSWAPSLTTTPIDEHWVGSSGDRDQRLAALDGTGFARYGPTLYANYFADLTTDLQFDNGEVELSTTRVGRFLGAEENVASLHGTFSVRGHSVAMTFEEMPGTTVFHWSREGEGINERFALTFTRTTAGRLYGAPAEAFFRIFSAEPFTVWGCC